MDPFAEHFQPSAASASADDRELRSEVHAGTRADTTLLDLLNDPPPPWFRGVRLGEASHPGPFTDLCLGCTNPSGLRGKESLAVGLGPGIWTFSETHLSSITQGTASRALKASARDHGRLVRPHHGAPAPLRSRSSWAGTHTGVLCLSDHKSQTLNIAWPDEMWTSGRVLATQHFVGDLTFTVISLYGFPRGPTWPQATQMMNEILEFLTKTFILGHSGLIAIMGDFNFHPMELEHFHMWRALGWISSQEMAAQRWNWDWTPTCKGATERDLIWLSPSLQSLCQSIHIEEVFSEHSAISIKVAVPKHAPILATWPRPQDIPWDSVDIPRWHAETTQPDIPEQADSTQFLKDFANHYERSLTGYVPGGQLQAPHCGRAARLKPAVNQMAPTLSKASRPGEICLKHDLVGTAVLRWYSQLRRLQSYLHSIRAAHTHANAVQYRDELWQAILKSSGFQGGFRHWWFTSGFFELLGPLPFQPPELSQAEWIFAAFYAAFRRFESWHMMKKHQVIQSKYDRTHKAVYQDLREPKPDQIDVLWDTHSYVVVATRPANRSILLDRPIEHMPHGHWYLNGCQLDLEGTLEELVVFKHWPNLEVGHTLVHQTHTTTDDEVHQRLIELWRPRWNQAQHVDDAVLARVSNFVQAYMPRFDFSLQDITPEDWYATVKRLKPCAARGTDGFARSDLLHMPLVFVQILLRFLMDIENGIRNWPIQFFESIVLALAKHSDAHTAGGYRPIVLFSMIYRCWASLRCRQLLRQLEAIIHDDAFGFLPHRETMQSWLLVQASLESALQTGADLVGLATDLVKAFNNINRNTWFTLASHVGIPTRILRPWKQFLGKFTRRFSVHGNLSQPVGSDTGFAEGDPLSVMAMVLLDWTLHVYQDQLAPSVRTMSFVDNISLMACNIEPLVMAFFSLKAFLELWGLQIDQDKSYCWGSNPRLRQLLLPLGISVLSDVTELGGSLTLGASRRVRLMIQRGTKLANRWQRLRISRAPLRQKLHCLATVFWPAALHGALGCVFSDVHIHNLRKTAVSHVGVKRGGANSLLRLSFSSPMTADPGYFQLRTCIMDFRRICGKSPDIEQLWRFYMHRFTGRTLSGPFCKLNELFCQIGWTLEDAPLFRDHDGCLHDFLHMPVQTMEAILEDAWLQACSHRVRHRSTMSDLFGIDSDLLRAIQADLTPANLSKVLALQTGAFISAWQHAKYDNTKQPICAHCFVPNTQKHWLTCPLLAPLRADRTEMLRWFNEIPSCALHHLLVPRPAAFAQMKAYFASLEDSVEVFLSSPGENTQHLFCDGSFFQRKPQIASTASWSVVNSTTGNVVGAGLLPGVTQSIARAELFAILVAAAWCRRHAVPVMLWSDSASTVRLVRQMLQGSWNPSSSNFSNLDLWNRLSAIIEEIPENFFQICWVPSHLDDVACTDSFEEWIAHWNGVADDIAVSANEQRGPAFESIRLELCRHFSLWFRRLTMLRDFYIDVSNFSQVDDGVVDLTQDDADFLQPSAGMICLTEALAVNWQSQLRQACFKFPNEFVLAVFEGICLLEADPEVCMSISFIELTLWLIHAASVPIPVWNPNCKCWEMRSYFGLFVRPTFASVLHQVKLAVAHGIQVLGLQDFECKGLNRAAAGINIPADGLSVQTSTASAAKLQTLTLDFAGSRKIRKSADLARPL